METSNAPQENIPTYCNDIVNDVKTLQQIVTQLEIRINAMENGDEIDPSQSNELTTSVNIANQLTTLRDTWREASVRKKCCIIISCYNGIGIALKKLHDIIVEANWENWWPIMLVLLFMCYIMDLNDIVGLIRDKFHKINGNNTFFQ